MKVYQERDLQSAKVLIATSEAEFANIRSVGLRQPVAIIPNGTHLDTSSIAIDRTPRRKEAVFLSRIHPKKGLPNLLAAWAKLRPQDWRLILAGPDEAGHLKEMRSLAAHLGIANEVEFVGEMDDAGKRKLLDSARLFVLPTHSENFGVVVAEALAHGVPVITTKGAPWSGLVDHRCGWWVDVGAEPLIPALQEAVSLDEAAWQAMSDNCRRFVQRFNWSDIARSTADTYRWVLGQGDRPDCVLMD